MKRVEMKGELVDNLWGDIYDWYGIDNVTPKKIRKAFEDAGGEDIVLEVNSPGGDVAVGSEIYYLINSYSGKVTADVVGYAGSAATFAILSADKVRIVPTGLFMIHCASLGSYGNADEKRHDAQLLDTTDAGLADAYVLKSKLDKDFVLDLMKNETWMNAQDAVDYGFADEVITPDRLVAGFGILSEADRKEMKQKWDARNAELKARAFFNLLNLKKED